MNHKYQEVLRIFSLIFLSLIISNSACGQSDLAIDKKNSIILEGLGHGFIYSLNYERVIYGNSKAHLSGQIGISYYGPQSGIVPLWVPISLNQSFRIKGNSYIEIGIGKMLRNDGVLLSDGNFVNNYQFEEWIFKLGYKLYFGNNKWLCKIAYTPIYQDKWQYIHWGGIGVGYRL